MQIDANGIAVIIAAVATAIVTVGTFVFSEIRKLHVMVNETKELVNGLSEKRQAEAEAMGIAKGKEQGKAAGEQAVAAITDLAKTAILKSGEPTLQKEKDNGPGKPA